MCEFFHDNNLHVSRETLKGVEFLFGRGIWYDDKEMEIEELINCGYFSR
jgi:hypothetical protein